MIKMDRIIEQLFEYSKIEGSELGELCNLLIDIFGYRDYFLTEGLKDAIESEIKSQLNNFEDYSKIVILTKVIQNKILIWENK